MSNDKIGNVKQGGQQQGGQRAQNGGENWGGAGLNGGPLPVGPNYGYVDPERALRDTYRDLSQLRAQLGPGSDVGREITDVLRNIQRPEYALGGPLLNERIEKEVLPAIEQLEMELRRKVEGDSATIRNPAADPVPAGYGDKVAEYFRRLSKTR